MTDMTPEEIARIEARYNAAYQDSRISPLASAIADVSTLLAEVKRLRAKWHWDALEQDPA